MAKEEIAIWVTIAAGVLSVLSDVANIVMRIQKWLRRRK